MGAIGSQNNAANEAEIAKARDGERRSTGQDSLLAIAVGRNTKGLASLALYAIGVLLSIVNPRIAMAMYVFVAVIWFIPDRRIEKVVTR